MYLIFTLLYLPFSKTMFGWFTNDRNVIELAPVFVSAIVWSFPAMAVMRATGGFVQGIGNAKLMMLLGILDGVVFRIFLSYGIGIGMGYDLSGFIFGFGCASYAFAIPAAIYLYSGIWEKRKQLI